jgi:hypothetical protein
MLVAVAAATIVVAVFDLAARTGISVLGPLPQGLPLPRLPLVSADSLGAIMTGGSPSRSSRSPTRACSRAPMRRVCEHQWTRTRRWWALASRTSPPPSFKASRSAAVLRGHQSPKPRAQDAADRRRGRGRDRGVAGVCSRAAQDLPNTALAAIVIAAAIGLIEVSDLRRIYRIQRWEFWLSMTCFAGVAVFGAVPGIVMAIVIAVIEFLWDGWRPHSAVLGQVEHLKGYHDIARYPGRVSFRASCCSDGTPRCSFANAEFFHDRVLAAIASSPRRFAGSSWRRNPSPAST